MTPIPTKIPAAGKSGLHPRNPHRFGYDFKELIKSHAALSAFVFTNKFGIESVDFTKPEAVKELNTALLKHHYGITYWDIPEGYLVPPIPGRADYIHHAADIMASANKGVIPTGHTIRVMDLGVGASCVYAIIGQKEYEWTFTGVDIDSEALRSSQKIIDSNESLQGSVELRLQKNPANLLFGSVEPSDEFDLVICNPPFHNSLDDVKEAATRKWKNLGVKGGEEPVLNFGGQKAELIFPGGEDAFVSRLVSQSVQLPTHCYWYTSLISKESTLKHVLSALKKVQPVALHTVNMSQGQKNSRLVAWTFLSEREQRNWKERHFWNM